MFNDSDRSGPGVALADPGADEEAPAPLLGEDARSQRTSGSSKRVLLFAALCGVCVLTGGGYTLRAMRHSTAQQAVAPGSATDREAISAKPHVFLAESATANLADHPIVMAPLASPDASRYQAGLSCERIYVTAGEGLCLTLGHNTPGGPAFIFDADFQPVHSLPATGIPSRARISADGRYGAMTYFVAGDAYTADGQFSTRTSLIDMHSGAIVANMEDFTIHKDGQIFRQADFNFWGVTFAQDSDHFYATLGTSGKTYLLQGDIAAREAHTLTENVECPSLSPDNRHIVFKKRIADGPPAIWRLTVLDLATMQQKPLAETRSVDDQAEWLDNDHVLYSPVTQHPGVWTVPADGTGQPRLFADGAVSPVVIH